jgi:MFS transporter, ACS family, glucarate transporter
LIVYLPAVLPVQFAFLVVLRFLFGMFQAGGFPAWARVLADWMPLQERGLAQGMVWTFSRLGGAISPFIFLGLLWIFGAWTTTFWVIAGLGVLWCAVFWPWFRNRPDEMSAVNAAERDLIAAGRAAPGPAHAGLPALGVPWSRMLRSVSVWALCLMYGFLGFSGNFITSLLPVFLKDHRHLNDGDRTWVFGLTLASGMVSCFAGGILSDRLIRWTGSRKWGRRLGGSVGMVMAGLAFLSVPWIDGFWPLAICFGAAFFGNDMSMGPAWASCADVAERHAGTLSGTMNMLGAFAGAGGMALAGVLLERQQYELLFLIFACSYGAGALCWLAVDVTRPLSASPSATEET